MSSSSENSNFTFSDDLNVPLLVVVIGLEMIAALLANSFVLIFTLCNATILKQPSVIFLTNLVVGNLITVILFMTPVIITTAAGEWIFGNTIEEKTASCQFVGFLYSQNVYLTSFTFAIISYDRFLFIVQPLLHKRFMTTLSAVLIVISAWILSGIIGTIPFIFGLSDQYVFDEDTGICGSAWISAIDYKVVFILVVLICIIIVTVTSMWTFCFTRRFIKHLAKESHTTSRSCDELNNVYNNRVRKIIGVFGALLIATAVTYAPGLVVGTVRIIIGHDSVPGVLYSMIHILFYLNYVLIPLIQLYFRKELKYYIVICYKTVQCKNESKAESTQASTSITAAISTYIAS